MAHHIITPQVASKVKGRLVSIIAIFLIISLEMMGGAEGKPEPGPQPAPIIGGFLVRHSVLNIVIGSVTAVVDMYVEDIGDKDQFPHLFQHLQSLTITILHHGCG